MSLRHAVAELIALWDSLPGLVGADWPGLAPLLTEAVDLLPGSASEQDFAARVAVILRLLQPYPGARERLAQALAADELRGDTPALTVAGSWSLLAHRLVMAAGGTGQTGQRPPAQWVNAEFEGHDAGRCLRPHQAYVLAFEAGPATRARAASVGAELRPGPGEEPVELTVQVVSPDMDVEPIEDTLTVRSDGTSANRARFRLTPARTGDLLVNALFLRHGNVVQLVTLTATGCAGPARACGWISAATGKRSWPRWPARPPRNGCCTSTATPAPPGPGSGAAR